MDVRSLVKISFNFPTLLRKRCQKYQLCNVLKKKCAHKKKLYVLPTLTVLKSQRHAPYKWSIWQYDITSGRVAQSKICDICEKKESCRPYHRNDLLNVEHICKVLRMREGIPRAHMARNQNTYWYHFAYKDHTTKCCTCTLNVAKTYHTEGHFGLIKRWKVTFAT